MDEIKPTAIRVSTFIVCKMAMALRVRLFSTARLLRGASRAFQTRGFLVIYGITAVQRVLRSQEPLFCTFGFAPRFRYAGSWLVWLGVSFRMNHMFVCKFFVREF